MTANFADDKTRRVRQRGIVGEPSGTRKAFLRVASLMGFAIVWEVFARAAGSLLLPTFSDTMIALVTLLTRAETWRAVLLSNQALVGGYLLALLVGVPLGLALGRSTRARMLLDAYLNVLIVTPTSALIPLIILATGLTLVSRVLVVFLFAFAVVAVNVEAGLRQIDPLLIEMARSFGASEAQLWRRILLPGALPGIMAGLRQGLGRALSGMVNVELLLLAVGVGRLILRFHAEFESAHTYAVMLIVVGEALLLMEIVKRLQSRLLHWQEGVAVR